MKHIFQKYLALWVVGAVAAVTAVGAVWYIGSSQAPSFGAVTATKGNVIESLNESAVVFAENNADLSFQEGGEIVSVDTQEGEAVAAGTVLATLNTASLEANVQQASAALAVANAKLAELQAGTRPEQIAFDQTAVTNAKAALAVDVGNAYAAADDAIHNQTDNLFNNPRTNNPTFLVQVADTQLVNNIENERVALEASLDSWRNVLGTPAAVSVADTALPPIQAYLNNIAIAVNDAIPDSTITSSALAGYKAEVVAARTEVNAAIAADTAAESALSGAQGTLSLAEAGSTPQEIAAQQAAVAEAQAAQSAAQVALANAQLVAPFSGTVQNLTAQVGQVVTPGVPVLSLVNNGGLKIDAYASEADVANIKTGDAAQITLDAFGSGTAFPAIVTTVDSVETQRNGAPAYLVTLHFTKAEPQIKDGMTGNARIILAEHDNVVEVPSRLVINSGNQYYVLIPSGSTFVRQSVTVGITGDDGMTEITSGISVGQSLSNF